MKKFNYNSPDWRKKRADLIEGKSCEWCGSTDKLALHHTHETRDERRGIERKIIYELIKEKFSTGELQPKVLPLKYSMICPKCSSKIIKHTKGTGSRIVPPFRGDINCFHRYQCEKCQEYTKIRFDEAKYEYIYEPVYKLTRDEYLQFLNNYKNEIEQKVSHFFQKEILPYEDMQDTIILCKRCHYAVSHGLHLCPNCRKNYALNIYFLCKTCFLKTPEGEKWSQSQKELSKHIEIEEALLDMVEIMHKLEAEGKHEDASKLYKDFLDKYPDDEGEDDYD
jgi:hypothetical protein